MAKGFKVGADQFARASQLAEALEVLGYPAWPAIAATSGAVQIVMDLDAATGLLITLTSTGYRLVTDVPATPEEPSNA